MSNNIKDVSYRIKKSSNIRKNRGSWRVLAFLMFFVAISLYVAMTDMSAVQKQAEAVQKQAEAYSTPDKLTEAVREQSKECVNSMTVIQCYEDTQDLESKAEILTNEAQTRKDIINQLFEDYEN